MKKIIGYFLMLTPLALLFAIQVDKYGWETAIANSIIIVVLFLIFLVGETLVKSND